MRWDIPTATAVWKKGKDTSDQYLEKNAQLRTRCLLSRGNQSQFARNPDARSRPATIKANRQSCQSANPRATGTLTAEVSMPMAKKALTACARLSGEMTSDNTPTEVGGSVPAARPVNTLSARNISILGAKAEATTDATSNSSPARITGRRRPKESDKGPRRNQGDRPSCEGCGCQLTRDRH